MTELQSQKNCLNYHSCETCPEQYVVSKVEPGMGSRNLILFAGFCLFLHLLELLGKSVQLYFNFAPFLITSQNKYSKKNNQKNRNYENKKNNEQFHPSRRPGQNVRIHFFLPLCFGETIDAIPNGK